MKWVTRKQIRVNRTATGWLVRRFLDPEAEFIFGLAVWRLPTATSHDQGTRLTARN